MRLPSLKQLHHLVALFDHQHFGRAADACFISQSTLSASITQLEAVMGVALLEREHKAFVFTPLGEEIVQRSRRIINESIDLMDYAKTQGKPMQGSLRLGCIPTIAPFIMNSLIKACSDKYPELTLLIREDTTDNLIKLLEEGRLDLAIFALPYPTKYLYAKILSKDHFHLVYPPNWVDKIENEDITTWPDKSIFLLEKEHCLTDHTFKACDLRQGNKINPFFATSLHTLVQMVQSGLGVTFLPQLAINKGILEGTQLLTRPMSRTAAHRNLGIVWRNTSHQQENYQLFADVLKTVLEKSTQ
jgi:LysR family hydrogen peroxide-inducible transcriptional activator